MSASHVLEVEWHDAVALVRLERPERRNALDLALCRALIEAMEHCADARAIVLTGAGKAFCAGEHDRRVVRAGTVAF